VPLKTPPPPPPLPDDFERDVVGLGDDVEVEAEGDGAVVVGLTEGAFEAGALPAPALAVSSPVAQAEVNRRPARIAVAAGTREGMRTEGLLGRGYRSGA
jgi:hypothetical protein